MRSDKNFHDSLPSDAKRSDAQPGLALLSRAKRSLVKHSLAQQNEAQPQPENMGRSPVSVRLYPHQITSASTLAALLSKRKTACDTSETGCGKTLSALKAAEMLGLEFLVVCPKNVRSHWQGWVAELGLESKCVAIGGWEEFKLGLKPFFYRPQDGFFGGNARQCLVIFDESHRAKNFKTANARMVAAARRQGLYTLLLSATLLQSPLNLSGLAYPLGLIHHPRAWFDYARQYGAGIGAWGGYDDLSTREQRLRLHHLLSQIGVRVRREDIPDFRQGIVQADLLDAGEAREKIACQYEATQAEIAKLLAEGAASAVVLTARLRGRQAIELLKAPLFREIAEEHLEAGAKVALFLNFNATIDFLASERWEVPFRVLTGQTGERARGEALNAFQGGPVRLLILNLGVGAEAISLHDVDGNERVSLISPGEKSTDLIQAVGRNVRVGARSPGLNRLLYIAGTVEEVVYNNTRRKIRNIGELLDADMNLLGIEEPSSVKNS